MTQACTPGCHKQGPGRGIPTISTRGTWGTLWGGACPITHTQPTHQGCQTPAGQTQPWITLDSTWTPLAHNTISTPPHCQEDLLTPSHLVHWTLLMTLTGPYLTLATLRGSQATTLTSWTPTCSTRGGRRWSWARARGARRRSIIRVTNTSEGTRT